MKVEGGGVATSSGAAASVLHRIKVKEESKDCSAGTALQTSSNVSPPSPSPSAARSLAIGAIATITISSGCSSELTSPMAVEPVDLDLKSGARAKAAVQSSREKLRPREDGAESRGSSSPSPSSSPSSSSHYNQTRSKQQQQQQHSADSDDCPPALQSLKTESQDDARQDEPRSADQPSNSGARCISGIFAAHGKLKRLLGTLVQFAMDISPDTGDTVRTLVLGLLSGSMTAEEFHSALQEATNFPLRGFVLPYLKHTLPSLQRDLSAAARADNQTCGQYLRSNETAVLEAVGLVSAVASTGTSGGQAEDPFGTEHVLAGGHPTLAQHYALRPSTMHPIAAAPPHLGFGIGVAAKRRASDALYYENGALFDEGPPYPKRPGNPWTHHPHPQHHPQQSASSSHHHHLPHQQQQQQQQQQQHDSSVYNCWYSHPSLQAGSSSSSSLPGYGALSTAAAHLSHQPAAHANPGAASNGSATSSLDDEWKNIHVMLNCILGMVEKTKRALAILQKRGCTSPAAAAPNGPAQPLNNGAPQQAQEPSAQDRDGSFKRLSGEIVAQTIRATEDRVAEVKRRAEEAVQEVKRVAMAEVQRAVAVAVAESRASERRRYLDNLPMSQQPRAHHGRPAPFLPTPARSGDDVDKEPHSGSSCWNCGRPALETCGGCGVARYCGSFCQHRDWEAGGHHATCVTTTSSASSANSAQQAERSATPSPTSGENNATDPAKSAVPRAAK